MSNILTKGEGIPGWGKAVLYIGGLGLAAIVGYKIYKGIAKKLQSLDDFKEAGAVKDELKNLADAGIKPTMSEDKYLTKANQIHTAMDGYGTNVAAIISAIGTLNNDADMLALIKAYGVKTISSGKFNPEPDFTGTMPSSFTNELNPIDQSMVNATLEKRKLKYRI